MRISRIAVTGCTVAALTLAGAVTASAEQPSSPPPGPVTVTLSPEQVSFLCERRLPRMAERVTKLLERINGGVDVRGSTEWLKRRAEQERAAGRETSAQLLEERAQRRAGQTGELTEVKDWVADFRSKYCGETK